MVLRTRWLYRKELELSKKCRRILATWKVGLCMAIGALITTNHESVFSRIQLTNHQNREWSAPRRLRVITTGI